MKRTRGPKTNAANRVEDRRPRRHRSRRQTVARRDARLLRSARSAGRGRFRRALRGYLGLVAETPDDLQARNRAGDLLLRTGEIARALELFVEVAERWRDAGFEDKAAAIDRKILRLVPEHEATRRARHEWLERRGRTVEARRLAARLYSRS